jgi:hypothetical protein
MEKYYYSYDEENFSFDSIEEAAEGLWNDGYPLEVGDVETIYQGEAIETKASSFLPSMASIIMDQAYDECGDFAERWDLENKKDAASLQEYLQNAFDEWANKNDMQPNFYLIKNVKPIKIEFVDEEGGCEILNENE